MRSAMILLGLSPFIALVNAHTIFTTLFINDASQGDGTCVRMNTNPELCTSPIPSLSSDDMACGIDGDKAVAFTCPTSAGSKLTFLFREWADGSNPGSIDPSHKGPCAVYIKPVKDSSTSAAGPGWFKLWHEGYDAASGQWCIDKLIANKGELSIDLPIGLPGGNYFIRPELLTLQDVNKNDPQFYTGCAQLYIENAVTAPLNVPKEYSVSIPGHVKAGDPSVTFNIYTNKADAKAAYPIPGPKVFPVPSDDYSPPSSTSQNQIPGAVPANCLIKNANWCGVEVPDYKTEAGCWSSSEDCWHQADACYDGAPPSGNVNCRVWEKKCKNIQNHCSDGDFVGPPNKGQKLKGTDTMPVDGSGKKARRSGSGSREGRWKK